MQNLARHVIIRGWLDSVGWGAFNSWTPVKKLKQEANDWIGSEDYYYWSDMAGLEPHYLNSLYTKFILGYNNGMFKSYNPQSMLINLFKTI